ncbi:hypothetical protein, partial [Klebsiella pneumoniae]
MCIRDSYRGIIMSNKDSLERKVTPRKNEPVFPMALRVGIAEDICFLELVDFPEKESGRVFYSIALTKKHAKNLIDGLNKFVESGD